jgi:spore germination protein GerM
VSRHQRRRWASLAAASLVAGGLLGGCGLPTDGTPRAIKRETVPYNLLGVNETDAPMPAADADVRAVTVYVVREVGGKLQLQPSSRLIATPVNLDTVVANLMAGGITPEERENGYANLIPGKELVSITQDETTTIQVTQDFFDRLPKGQSRRLAIAQIVYTVTGFEGAGGRSPIDFVRFTVDGEVRTVPTDDGQTQPIVSQANFADFDPSATTTTDTDGPPQLLSTTTSP